MGIVINPEAKSFADRQNNYRVHVADNKKRHLQATKEARRNINAALQKFYEESELYGPRIVE